MKRPSRLTIPGLQMPSAAHMRVDDKTNGKKANKPREMIFFRPESDSTCVLKTGASHRRGSI